MGATRPKDSAIKHAAIHQYKTGVLSRSCVIQEFYETPLYFTDLCGSGPTYLIRITNSALFVYTKSFKHTTVKYKKLGNKEDSVWSSKQLPPCLRLTIERKYW